MNSAINVARQSILCYPHARLLAPARVVGCDEFPKSLFVSRLRKLRENLEILQGFSIAGPQMNVDARIILLRKFSGVLKGGTYTYDVLVNPEIKYASDEKVGMWEACMSLDALLFWVLRSRCVEVSCLNEYGEQAHHSLQGFRSILFQHEYSHLQGKSTMDEIENRDYATTRLASLQKKAWPRNFPSFEAFTTPLYALFDFTLHEVVPIPELENVRCAFKQLEKHDF